MRSVALKSVHETGGTPKLRFPVPTATGFGDVFPLCPVADIEVWDGWNGSFPRRIRCMRAGEAWLEFRRDDTGRIISIVEARVPGIQIGEAGSGFESNRREIRFEWYRDSLAPARIWVEIDGRSDGLETRFSVRGLPTRTRHWHFGKADGLEVEWANVRAERARFYQEGQAFDIELFTRWTEGTESKGPPILRLRLDPEPGARPIGDAAVLFH